MIAEPLRKEIMDTWAEMEPQFSEKCKNVQVLKGSFFNIPFTLANKSYFDADYISLSETPMIAARWNIKEQRVDQLEVSFWRNGYLVNEVIELPVRT